MNLVVVDCLLDINSTGLYNTSFLQDCLMFVDKLLAGRLSKTLNSTKWADEGSKLLHLCFIELRRIKRNTRTGERHAPWLKALLNKMTTEGNPLQDAKSQFFESRRSTSSSSVATGRRSFASRSPPPRSSQRGLLLRVASSPKEVLGLPALMDGTVDEQQPPAMAPTSPVSTPALTGSVFYDVAKGMACMVENEAGHAFSNQYTCKGEIREYMFPNGQKVEILVKAKVPRQVADEQHEGGHEYADQASSDEEAKETEGEPDGTTKGKHGNTKCKKGTKGKGKGKGTWKGKGKGKGKGKESSKGKGKESSKGNQKLGKEPGATQDTKGKGAGKNTQRKSDKRKLEHSKLWHKCYKEKLAEGKSKEDAKMAAKEYARRQLACLKW